MSAPVLYVDLASPYAYLAAARVQRLFREPVVFQPVLLGAIFEWRGWGSWAKTERRDSGMAEVEDRARRYGLPALVWPGDWPANSLAANRAAIWAGQQGRGAEFILAVYGRHFGQGEDIADVEVLAAAAIDAGLDAPGLREAIQRPEIKDALRRATEAAWELGVQGIPTLRVGARLFYGDDQLEQAAESEAAA